MQRTKLFLSALTKAIFVLSLMTLLAPAVTLAQGNIIDSVTESVSEAYDRNYVGPSNCANMTDVTSPIRKAGSKAFRHFVANCGNRAELRMRPTQIGRTYWYGWSLFLPSDFDPRVPYTYLNQWAAYEAVDGREGNFPEGGNGHHLLVTRDGKIRYTLQHQAPNNNPLVGLAKQFDLVKNVNDVKGKWVDFVMHVKWAGIRESGGFLDLWMKVGDGQYERAIPRYEGVTWYSDEGLGPFFKMGIYMGGGGRIVRWEGSTRIYYTDEYRLGNANATCAEVAPGGSCPGISNAPPQPPPATTVINEGFSQDSDIDYIDVLGGGLWQVQDGKLRLTNPADGGSTVGNANIATYSTNVPDGNFTLTAEAAVTNTDSTWNDFSVVFGFEDINNYYFASFNESNAAGTSGLFRVSNGVTAELSDITQTITANTAYNVRVERRGAQIRAFLNDAQVATATDSTFAGGGRVGFGTRNDAATFDNLRVTR